MEQIKTLREAAGLTQTELARRLGMKPCSVSIMEKPGRYPDVSKLPAIAEHLGCSIDALFGRSVSPSTIPAERSQHHGA